MHSIRAVGVWGACAPGRRGCTSFAVWSDQVWYGMNFDYYSTTPFLVSIVEEGGSELFLMAYLLRNIYVPTVGIDQVRNVL
jgi:hypothetical protein